MILSLQVLSGDDQAFLGLKDLCESWYCMLVSRLLYQNPGVKALDLQYHTQVGTQTLAILLSSKFLRYIFFGCLDETIFAHFRHLISSARNASSMLMI